MLTELLPICILIPCAWLSILAASIEVIVVSTSTIISPARCDTLYPLILPSVAGLILLQLLHTLGSWFSLLKSLCCWCIAFVLCPCCERERDSTSISSIWYAVFNRLFLDLRPSISGETFWLGIFYRTSYGRREWVSLSLFDSKMATFTPRDEISLDPKLIPTTTPGLERSLSWSETLDDDFFSPQSNLTPPHSPQKRHGWEVGDDYIVEKELGEGAYG